MAPERPDDDDVNRPVDLIREHGKCVEPEAHTAAVAN
jgi:hypothetical protein